MRKKVKRKPQGDDDITHGHDLPGRKPPGDGGERQLTEHDQRAVQGNDQSIRGRGKSQFRNIQSKRGGHLEKDQPGGQVCQQHLMQLAVMAQNRKRLAPTGDVLPAGGIPGQSHPREHSKQQGGARIADEQPEKTARRQQPGRGGTKGEPGIERHAQGRKGRDPLRRRHEVGQQRAARRTIKFAGQPGERRQDNDHRQAASLRQCQHHTRAQEHGEHNGAPPAQPVGQITTE